MTKTEFILRAASNAPTCPAYYVPEYPPFISPEPQKENEPLHLYKARVHRERVAYMTAKEKHRLETWPLYYAETLAADVERENPEIFSE